MKQEENDSGGKTGDAMPQVSKFKYLVQYCKMREN